MPPRTNDTMIAGPALAAAAWPVSTKMPAPMMAPIPSVTRLMAGRQRRSGTLSAAVGACASGALASASSVAIGLRIQRLAMAISERAAGCRDNATQIAEPGAGGLVPRDRGSAILRWLLCRPLQYPAHARHHVRRRAGEVADQRLQLL